ncbi:hypothetical protein [Polymorphospora sp. NPDC050346]|uniref:hypothetical protein n=1 Tax=Polymorphospora sp. NPDC050346 TaxID=3155780 RepID=UPI0033E95759
MRFEQWQWHVVEVETSFRPTCWPVRHRDRSTTRCGPRSTSARYTAQGLWGLVDQRTERPYHGTGRADARLVEVIQEVVAAETNASTGRDRRCPGTAAIEAVVHLLATAIEKGRGPPSMSGVLAGAAYRLLLTWRRAPARG